MKNIFLSILLLANFSYAQGVWELVDEMQYPVAGGSALNYNNYVYIFGGSDSLQRQVNWVQKFDPNSGTWELDSMSSPRYGLVSQTYNNSAYLFGGIFDESFSVDGIESWENTFANNPILSFNTNFNRIFSTGHIIGDNFYIIGGNPLPGTSNDSVPYIIEYNIPTDSITFKTDSLFITDDLPEQQMSAVINNDIYIFGGIVNTISNKIFKFNTASKEFEELETKLLEERAGGRAVVDYFYGGIYIIGGYDESLNALNTVEYFNNNQEMEKRPNINVGRYNFMSSIWNDAIYIFGGYNSDDKVVKNIEVYYGDAATTAAEEKIENSVINDFKLFQNYPNPFNPNTTIKYSIPSEVKSEKSKVNLFIYDILGNELVELVNKNQNPGTYTIQFNAGNFPSGIYYYQLRVGSEGTNSFIQTKKMILLK